MSDKPSSKVGVRTVREEIAIIAGPRDWGDTRESWLNRAALRVRTVPFRMIRSLFYGEIIDANHWAAHEIRRAAELITARKEAIALASQFESIAGALDAKDPDFYGADVAALIDAARKIRGEDRA